MMYERLSYKVRVDSDGRVKLPKKMRKIFNVEAGGYIVIDCESEIVTLGRPWDPNRELAKRLASLIDPNARTAESASPESVNSVGTGRTDGSESTS
jgi:bifunctional DNA-binding transcriptional regulator/antitoxin component of YhaV-PrlF toxin-antitoxin module